MISVIIAAAGKGVRMNSGLRKQYILLGGRPILAYSLIAFDLCDLIDSIILVVPEGDTDYCQKHILASLEIHKDIRIVPGGEKRQDSVYNGLVAADKDNPEIVVVHDGARPFVSQSHLKACINGAKEHGACIVAIPADDTLKQLNNSGFICSTIKRDNIVLAQTPQAFQYNLIIKAHKKARTEGFSDTDDACLIERSGKSIKVVYGSRRNMKITSTEDLILAEALTGAKKC